MLRRTNLTWIGEGEAPPTHSHHSSVLVAHRMMYHDVCNPTDLQNMRESSMLAVYILNYDQINASTGGCGGVHTKLHDHKVPCGRLTILTEEIF